MSDTPFSAADDDHRVDTPGWDPGDPRPRPDATPEMSDDPVSADPVSDDPVLDDPVLDDPVSAAPVDDSDRNRKTRSLPLALLVAALVALFPILFIGAGIGIHVSTRPYRDGITVTGVVVDVVPGRSDDGDEVYAPVVEFVDPGTGERHRQVRSVRSSDRPEQGDRWEVSFRPGEPERARVLGNWDWLFAAIFFTIGLVALVIYGLVLWTWTARRSSRVGSSIN